MKPLPLFIHIPKNGGMSIIRSIKCKHFYHKGMAPHHRPMKDIEITPDMFVFCCIRNPLDRLVSAFHYLKGGGRLSGYGDRWAMRYVEGLTFEQFCDKLFRKPHVYFEQSHLRPQCFWIDPQRLDYAMLFDRFDEEVAHIVSWLRQIPPEHKHENPSKHGPFMEYYTKRTKRRISRTYAEDFALYDRLSRQPIGQLHSHLLHF